MLCRNEYCPVMGYGGKIGTVLFIEKVQYFIGEGALAIFYL